MDPVINKNCLGTKDSRGFTLVEVMVSLSAMAIAFVAIWGLYFACLKIDIRNNREAEALYWGNFQLERMRNMTLPLVNGNDTVGPAASPYTRTWTVTFPQPWENQVTVTVTWTERGRNLVGANISVPRSIQLTTVIANLQ